MALTAAQMAPAATGMTLYHCIGGRSMRILWTLKEMGLTNYKLVTMPFPPRFFQKDYLKLNPLGTIPFFIDGDVRMTESCAVPRYLVDRYGPSPLGVQPHEADYGAYLNWIAHADATLTFPQTVALRYTLQEPDRAPNAAEDYARWFVARLKLLSAALADGREFLCCNRFTIADICITFALNLGKAPRPLHERYSPETRVYMDRMLARPAYQAAQREEAESAKQIPAGAPAVMGKLTKPPKL
eukprot:TRINITY_DN60780_c0_g1_i1.p2 TRINITY_DN60780_c0_g1~~TRINITY_DN60780_c0_g1_i1.p2  ORF type:complete len:269 (+),score=86.78 TRINITY_DN60780_c0_g1_i1:84-809(+)